MSISFSKVEELLPGYLSGELSDKDRAIVENWRAESPEHEMLYCESLKAWEALSLLNEMEQFNSFEALKKINPKLSEPKTTTWWIKIQRIAAILLLPLLVYSSFLTIKYQASGNINEQILMKTVCSRQGMVSQFTLADGTKVWLNSGSELQFPDRFSGEKREVMLKGEAFFEVTKK